MRLMIRNNKKQIVNNLDNVVRHLPNDRVFTVFGKKYNDYSSPRFVLNLFFIFFLDYCCRKPVDLFTPVIRTAVFSYLPYYHKRVLPLVRRDFTFENDPEFVTVNKYSSLLFTTWSSFYKDTQLVFSQILRDFFDNYTKIVKKMHCNHERIIGIVLNSINQIGGKSTLGHLFFCSRKYDSKSIYLLGTKMICVEETCGNILGKLDEILLSEILYNLLVDQENYP